MFCFRNSRIVTVAKCRNARCDNKNDVAIATSKELGRLVLRLTDERIQILREWTIITTKPFLHNGYNIIFRFSLQDTKPRKGGDVILTETETKENNIYENQLGKKKTDKKNLTKNNK